MRKILILILALVLAGCSLNSPDNTPVQPTTEPDVFPTSATPPTPYPEPTDPAAPTPTELPTPTFEEVLPTDVDDQPLGPEFFVDPPVEVGVSQINGRGPVNLPIVLIDRTDGGKTLAETTIGADGKFTLDVAGKLVEGHQIALKLGDISGTNIDPSDYASGDNYTQDPDYGTLFIVIEVDPAGG
jgi:hypothetical protein